MAKQRGLAALTAAQRRRVRYFERLPPQERRALFEAVIGTAQRRELYLKWLRQASELRHVARVNYPDDPELAARADELADLWASELERLNSLH